MSPDKAKRTLKRKISWTDSAAKPLAVVGPTAYYSDRSAVLVVGNSICVLAIAFAS